MDCPVLVLNAGSSTLKYAAYRADGDGTLTALARGKVDGHDLDSIAKLLERHLEGKNPSAVGHRVVHGGADFVGPTAVDDRVLAALEKLVPLDPLHQPLSLGVLRAASARFPSALHVACFDTSFHRGHPEFADVVALPRPLREAGVRRYGFHGLSYEYVARRLAELDPEIAKGRVVAAHLGNGASLCALRNGRSVDSTMSFTALDGLVMSTRPGSLDAGVILWLLDRGWDRERIVRLVWEESGLLALSETSGDLRELLAAGTSSARLAVDVFVYAAVKQAAAMAAALGGLDGLVFTAGIGENQPETRRRIADGLSFLGVALDEEANRRNDVRIGASGARVPTFVIPTDEEDVIGRHTLAVVRERGLGT
ncbi:MAG TPA: acetate kinase [Thermoanaerobaculia bacterium]|nr:acetate kinase [Thermoanaerobaculia bacterium]